MDIPREFILPYIIINFLCLVLIVLCARKFSTGKNIIGLIFLAACFINIYHIIKDPESYIDYGKTSLLYFYTDFIYGEFKNIEVVFLLIISAIQLFIAISLFGEGLLLGYGIVLGIIFLILIAPLGVSFAFPSPLLIAIALLILHKKRVRKIRERMQSQDF